MSLSIVRKNSGSPFHLQRSIVDRGEGGVYESGGYNPDTVYNDGGVSEAISGLGKVVAAGISSRTVSDENDSNLSKKERLDKRETRLQDKKKNTTDVGKTDRLDKRLGNIDKKQEVNDAKIKKYDDNEKLTLKSDIVKVKPKEKTIDVSSNDTKKSLLGWNNKRNK